MKLTILRSRSRASYGSTVQITRPMLTAEVTMADTC